MALICDVFKMSFFVVFETSVTYLSESQGNPWRFGPVGLFSNPSMLAHMLQRSTVWYICVTRRSKWKSQFNKDLPAWVKPTHVMFCLIAAKSFQTGHSRSGVPHAVWEKIIAKKTFRQKTRISQCWSAVVMLQKSLRKTVPLCNTCYCRCKYSKVYFSAVFSLCGLISWNLLMCRFASPDWALCVAPTKKLLFGGGTTQSVSVADRWRNRREEIISVGSLFNPFSLC